MEQNKINFKNFWYIACQSKELKDDKPLARTILGEWLVLFRDETGKPVVMQDRCTHRNFQLSKGYVKNGCLQCPYHGWTYDNSGEVVAIPAEAENFTQNRGRKGILYQTLEQDGFVYVCLEPIEGFTPPLFRMPHYNEAGFKTVRLFNKFKNDVTNCAENYVDVPHTVFVHDEIFRVSRQEKVEARVERMEGTVKVEYFKETNNIGWFSWFLNPGKSEIKHVDYFHSPNVTSVEYIFGPNKEFYITSHCVPVSDEETYVYTDLTFKFGFWNIFASPIVRYQGQAVINQDLVVLENQMKVIKKYGTNFSNSRADIVHVFIESIRDEIAKGNDPTKLTYKKQDFEFWV